MGFGTFASRIDLHVVLIYYMLMIVPFYQYFSLLRMRTIILTSQTQDVLGWYIAHTHVHTCKHTRIQRERGTQILGFNISNVVQIHSCSVERVLPKLVGKIMATVQLLFVTASSP